MTRPPLNTVAGMKAEGYTHLQGYCVTCRVAKHVPWELLRGIRAEMTLEEIGLKLRCETCGGPIAKVQSSAQHLAPGYDRGPRVSP